MDDLRQVTFLHWAPYYLWKRRYLALINIKKNDRNRVTDVENKLMVTRGERGGEG